MRYLQNTVIISVLIMAACPVGAQSLDPIAAARHVAATGARGDQEGSQWTVLNVEQEVPERRNTPITTRQKVIRYTTLVVIPLAMTAYGQRAWEWGSTGSSWHWAHEGFLGADTHVGGADKMGHAFSHYVLTRASAAIFDYTEHGASHKLWYAGSMVMLIGVGIEVGDAFNGTHGFSFEDIVFDALGVGLGVLTEAVPAADALFSFQLDYWPTQGFLDYPDRKNLQFSLDYSGMTFMLSVKLAGLNSLGLKVPSVLNYIQLDAGYFTRDYSGYNKFDRYLNPDAVGYRSALVGVSLNVPKLLDSLFTHVGKKDTWANTIVREPFNYYHLPIGLSVDTRLDE